MQWTCVESLQYECQVVSVQEECLFGCLAVNFMNLQRKQ